MTISTKRSCQGIASFATLTAALLLAASVARAASPSAAPFPKPHASTSPTQQRT